MAIDAADERVHRPPDGWDHADAWVESWVAECVTEDASLGLRMELRLRPSSSRCEASVLLVRRDRPLVWLHEPDAPLPRPGLEVRASGLWMQFIAQDPLVHFTADLEAFALELDDPGEARRSGFGRRVPVACELEWQTREAAVATEGGYKIPAFVMGDFQVAHEDLQIDAWGWRSHTWGAPVPVDPFRGRDHDAAWNATADLGLVVGWGFGIDGERHRLVETETGVGWRSLPG